MRVVALDEVIKEGNDVTTQKIKDKMLYLMDMNTESMIYKKAQEKGLI